jgi:hypothetical protein
VDLLEEQCVNLFYKPDGGNSHGGKKGKATQNFSASIAPKDVSIPKKKFRKWWTQGELSENE